MLRRRRLRRLLLGHLLRSRAEGGREDEDEDEDEDDGDRERRLARLLIGGGILRRRRLRPFLGFFLGRPSAPSSPWIASCTCSREANPRSTRMSVTKRMAPPPGTRALGTGTASSSNGDRRAWSPPAMDAAKSSRMIWLSAAEPGGYSPSFRDLSGAA